MITYFVTKRHAYTIDYYLKTWGQALAGRFRVVPYESILGRLDTFEARPGTYIFSDVERLGPMIAELAVQVWRKISALGDEARILNHPTRSMRRYELLRALFERGDNAFDVYRMVESRRPRRWPVFIRQEHEHTKNLTPLLHTPEELDAAAAEILEKGYSRESRLVVEFCDTGDGQDLFYVYGALLVGESVIPSHLYASRGWSVHIQTSVRTPEVLENERRFMETNPQEREIREVFRLAQIDYGRMDYSMLGDRVQVWEINTNPGLFVGGNLHDTERKTVIGQRAEQIAAAFADIDARDAPHEPAASE